MKVYVKQLYDEKGNKIPINIPSQGSDRSAGYDIVATSNPKIVGQKFTPVGYESSEVGNEWTSIDYIEYETNLHIAPEAVTFHTLIHPRSSVSKYNLVLANSIGLVDNDYRGMVICRFKYIWQPEDFRVLTINAGNQGSGNIYGRLNPDKIYKKGDKIAQLVVEPTVQVEWELVDDLSQTQRGEGGFGSTDTKTKEQSTAIATENNEGLVGLFKKSSLNIPTPPKNAYVNMIKERDRE